MNEVEAEQATEEALAWFGQTPAEGEWVNATWIARAGDAELRLVDVVGAKARHRVLLRYVPSDDPVEEWPDLDYDEVQEIVDRVKATSQANGWPLLDFSGPVIELPEWLKQADI